MTPFELRVRAFKNIESAKALLQSDPDYASYTVGYALEYVLKSRFCSKFGLKSFPDDRKEARKLQVDQAFTHNLDDLLRLTDGESVKSGGMVSHVDWAVAADWGVDRRYTPVGSLDIEFVTKQIDETEKVCIRLCEYELLEQLQKLEISLSQEHGPFSLFVYCWNPDFHWWELLISFWAFNDEERARREVVIDDGINDHIDLQLQKLIGSLRFFHPTSAEASSFYAHISTFIGPVQHALQVAAAYNSVAGLKPIPPAWIFTCADWSEASVLTAIQAIPNSSVGRSDGSNSE